MPLYPGWPEPRLHLEGQHWFTDKAQDIDNQSKHTHVGACAPYGQVVRGMLTLDVLLQMHEMDDRTITRLRGEVEVPSPESGTNSTEIITFGEISNFTMDCSAPEDLTDCKRVLRLVMNISRLQDGWRSFRVSVSPREKDPRNMNDLSKGQDFSFGTVMRFDAYIANSQPSLTIPPAVPNSLVRPAMGRGFMDFPWSYSIAWLYDPPLAPVADVWRMRVRTSQASPVANVTRSVVSLDPRFHITPAFVGRVLVNETRDIDMYLSIDTRNLTNGYHRLFVRTDVFVPPTIFANTVFNETRPFPGSTLSGVLVVAFQVQNTQPPVPAPVSRRLLGEAPSRLPALARRMLADP